MHQPKNCLTVLLQGFNATKMVLAAQVPKEEDPFWRMFNCFISGLSLLVLLVCIPCVFCFRILKCMHNYSPFMGTLLEERPQSCTGSYSEFLRLCLYIKVAKLVICSE